MLASWNLPRVVEAAELIVSELVTNAMRASEAKGWPVMLRLSVAAEYLLILVWDNNPELPTKRDADFDDESGRGLVIVEALSDACGAAPVLEGGKAVWARLALTG